MVSNSVVGTQKYYSNKEFKIVSISDSFIMTNNVDNINISSIQRVFPGTVGAYLEENIFSVIQTFPIKNHPVATNLNLN